MAAGRRGQKNEALQIPCPFTYRAKGSRFSEGFPSLCCNQYARDAGQTWTQDAAPWLYPWGTVTRVDLRPGFPRLSLALTAIV